MAASSLLRHTAALTLGAALVWLPYGAFAASDHGSVVCSIPVGPDGVHYRNVDTPDELAWGPKSFAIDRRGNFYILDTVADRILVYSRDCRRLRSIRLPPGLVGAKDLEVADGFWVLDAAALPPMIFHLSSRGAVLGKYRSPIGLSDGLSGISVANDGGIQAEAHFGFQTVPVAIGRTTEGAPPQPAKGFARRGIRYSTQISKRSPNRGVIEVGQKRIPIQEPSALTTLRIVHVADDNRIYAEVGATGTSDTLRQYRPDGMLLRSAVLPKQDFIYIDRNVRVDSRGDVYVVVALPDRVEIRKLRFKRSIDRGTERTTELPEVAPPRAAISCEKRCLAYRPDQLKTAKKYHKNTTFIPQKSINGVCEGRIKPRYLTDGPKEYSSVPYKWGGWDTVARYNKLMSEKLPAGDINTTVTPPKGLHCSSGVDCSGLVSRAWGRTQHKWNTTILKQNSYLVDAVGSVQKLRQGDILLKNAKHVLIFEELKNGSVIGYEATTDGKFDRVSHMSRSVSQIKNQGYEPRRFNCMCDYVDVSIACDGQSPALFVDNLGFNFAGGDYFLREKVVGTDYNGSPICFKTTADYDRATKVASVTFAMFSNGECKPENHFRTDRCRGKWDDAKSTNVFDTTCKLVVDKGAGCPVVRAQMKIDETKTEDPIGSNALVRLGEKYGLQLLSRR